MGSSQAQSAQQLQAVRTTRTSRSAPDGSRPGAVPAARRPLRDARGPKAATSQTGADDGLRTDARRNLEQVLRAARDVFGETGYDASMEEIARRAQVGVGTIYRRFPGKDALVQRVIADETRRLAAEAERSLAEEQDPWAALTRHLRFALVSGTGRLLPLLGGRVPVTEEMARARADLGEVMARLVEQAQEAKALRSDVSDADISLLLSCLFPPVELPYGQRVGLAVRFLDIMLDGMRAEGASPLPGKPFTQSDLDGLLLYGRK